MRELSANEMDVFNSPQSSQGRYNWALWTNGHAYAAKPGEDFTSKPASFTYLLRAQATKRNLHVEIRTLESGEIVFQFSEPATEEAEETASETEPEQPEQAASKPARKSVRAA